MAFCPAEVTSFVLAVNFGGGLCESNAPETDWPPAGFEDRKGHQPPMPSAQRGIVGTRKPTLTFVSSGRSAETRRKNPPVVAYWRFAAPASGTSFPISTRASPTRLVSLMLS